MGHLFIDLKPLSSSGNRHYKEDFLNGQSFIGTHVKDDSHNVGLTHVVAADRCIAAEIG